LALAFHVADGLIMLRLNRPLLSLLPYLGILVARIALLGFCLLLGFLAPPMLVVGFFVALAIWRQYYWLDRFCRHVRRFRTVSIARVTLHYAPELEDRWFFPSLLDDIQKELADLDRQFEKPLRRRVSVFLFEHWREINDIFGPEYGGTALFPSNSIVFADDDRDIRDTVRHELTHLFANRWSTLAPPLLSEGLPVHLQLSFGGHSIDTIAREHLRTGSLPLLRLLDRKVFFSKGHIGACYALAGSFTGFLIRRYGWKKYRRLYRWCDGTMFQFKFRWCFGVSLAEAEIAWREELLSSDPLYKWLKHKPD
jgi:hypothetical protein